MRNLTIIPLGGKISEFGIEEIISQIETTYKVIIQTISLHERVTPVSGLHKKPYIEKWIIGEHFLEPEELRPAFSYLDKQEYILVLTDLPSDPLDRLGVGNSRARLAIVKTNYSARISSRFYPVPTYLYVPVHEIGHMLGILNHCDNVIEGGLCVMADDVIIQTESYSPSLGYCDWCLDAIKKERELR